jgi:hypothetical protein
MRKPSAANDWRRHRLEVLEKIKARGGGKDKSIKVKPIKVTLADGSVRDGTAGTTTPMDIAKQISNSLAESAMIAKVRSSTSQFCSSIHCNLLYTYI